MLPFIAHSRILPALKGMTKKEILRELASAVHKELPQLQEETLFLALQEREDIGSTGLGDGLAIPHAKLKDIPEIITYFGRSKKGVSFDGHDNKPVHLFFLLLAPSHASSTYLSCLAQLSRIVKTPSIRSQLLSAIDEKEISRILSEIL